MPHRVPSPCRPGHPVHPGVFPAGATEDLSIKIYTLTGKAMPGKISPWHYRKAAGHNADSGADHHDADPLPKKFWTLTETKMEMNNGNEFEYDLLERRKILGGKTT